MRNHETLLAIRRAGLMPPIVNIETDAGRLLFPTFWSGVSDHAVDVQIDPHEKLRHLDLRCFVDLVVNVAGCDDERVQAVAMACDSAGASRVIATTYRWDGEAFVKVRATDTEGASTWQG